MVAVEALVIVRTSLVVYELPELGNDINQANLNFACCRDLVSPPSSRFLSLFVSDLLGNAVGFDLCWDFVGADSVLLPAVGGVPLGGNAFGSRFGLALLVFFAPEPICLSPPFGLVTRDAPTARSFFRRRGGLLAPKKSNAAKMCR